MRRHCHNNNILGHPAARTKELSLVSVKFRNLHFASVPGRPRPIARVVRAPAEPSGLRLRARADHVVERDRVNQQGAALHTVGPLAPAE